MIETKISSSRPDPEHIMIGESMPKMSEGSSAPQECIEPKPNLNEMKLPSSEERREEEEEKEECQSEEMQQPAFAPGKMANKKVLSHIADGKQSSIWLCKDKFHGVIAIKVTPSQNEDIVKQVERELFVLQKCKDNGPFIVQALFFEQYNNRSVIGMEYCSQKDLFEYTRLKKPSYNSVRLCLVEVGIALEYLHNEAGVIHEDIKPENICIGSDGHIRIVDFCNSVHVAQDAVLTEENKDFDVTCSSGTVHYASPEKIQRLPHSFETDWWSYGVVAFELVFGFLPWCGRDDQETANMICSVPFTQHVAEDAVAVEVLDFISGLCEVDRYKRTGFEMGFEQIKMHSFFKGIDIDKVSTGQCPPFPLL